jgi:hypothetical protein
MDVVPWLPEPSDGSDVIIIMLCSAFYSRVRNDEWNILRAVSDRLLFKSELFAFCQMSLRVSFSSGNFVSILWNACNEISG